MPKYSSHPNFWYTSNGNRVQTWFGQNCLIIQFLEAIQSLVAAQPQSAGVAAAETTAAEAAIAIAAATVMAQDDLLGMLEMMLQIDCFGMIVFVVVMVMIMRYVLNYFDWLLYFMLDNFFLFDHQWLMVVVYALHLGMNVFMMCLLHGNVYYYFLLSVTVCRCEID